MGQRAPPDRLVSDEVLAHQPRSEREVDVLPAGEAAFDRHRDPFRIPLHDDVACSRGEQVPGRVVVEIGRPPARPGDENATAATADVPRDVQTGPVHPVADHE